MIVDTDVLVWYLRGNARAAEALAAAGRFRISAVTYMELVQGMRNKDELRHFRTALRAWGTEVLQIDDVISTRAMLYVEQYSLSHGMRLADALIAATAVAHGSRLLTGNNRHYRAIPDLVIEEFRPG